MALQAHAQLPRLQFFTIETWKPSPSPNDGNVDLKELKELLRQSAVLEDVAVEDKLEFLYDDMDAFEDRYPAATEVRDRIGDESLDDLEEYRWKVIDFSFWMRQLELDEDLRVKESSLDLVLPRLQNYVLRTWGKSIEEIFQRLHHDLVHMECVVDDAQHGGGEIYVKVGDPAKNIREMFRHHPLFWFIYNLYFPVEVRMSWNELMLWAIGSLQRDRMAPPSWTTKLLKDVQIQRQPQTANQIANNLIYDRAMVEIFQDLKRRFTVRLPPARKFPLINDDYLGNGGQQAQ